MSVSCPHALEQRRHTLWGVTDVCRRGEGRMEMWEAPIVTWQHQEASATTPKQGGLPMVHSVVETIRQGVGAKVGVGWHCVVAVSALLQLHSPSAAKNIPHTRCISCSPTEHNVTRAQTIPQPQLWIG